MSSGIAAIAAAGGLLFTRDADADADDSVGDATADAHAHDATLATAAGTPTVYLAGPIAHDADAARWRDRLKAEYGDRFTFLDPMDRFDVPGDDLDVVQAPDPRRPDQVGVAELVEGDLDMLRSADAVLVGYTAVESIGTPMEVLYARERLGLPVAMWVRDGTAFEALSPWYKYYTTTVCTAAEPALDHIQREVARWEVRDA